MSRVSDTPIPVDAGDFRLVDRRVVSAVRNMREQHRYLRGMFAWIGFDQTGVQYARDARHAGKIKFSMRKMVAFAIDGILGFSTAPSAWRWRQGSRCRSCPSRPSCTA